MIKTKPTLLAPCLLAIALALVALACGATPEAAVSPTELPAEPQPTAASIEPAQNRADIANETVKAAPTQTQPPKSEPTPPASQPSAPAQVMTMPIQPVYVTTKGLDGPDDDLAKLALHSSVIVIGTIDDEGPRVERIQSRDPNSPTGLDPNVASVGNVYDVRIERYLKGDGDATLSLIEFIGMDYAVPGPGGAPGMLTEARDTTQGLLPNKNSRYLLFLREQGEVPDLWMGPAHPYRFLISPSGEVSADGPVGDLDGAFQPASESDFINQVEELISGR